MASSTVAAARRLLFEPSSAGGATYVNIDEPLPHPKLDGHSPGIRLVDVIAVAVGAGLALQLSGFVLLRSYLVSDMCDSQVLMWSEAIKLLVSVAAGWRETQFLFERAHRAVVPVVTYGAMNLLSFYSLKRLPANISIVIVQLKTVWTALFARVFLGRALFTPRAFALVALVAGCVAITAERRELDEQRQFADYLDDADANARADRGALFDPQAHEVSLFAAVMLILEGMLSGLMSVYMEVIFEMHVAIMWRRNVQLSFFSVGFYFLVSRYPYADMEACSLSTYVPDGSGWILAVVAAAGGLLVALSLLYSGAVGKVVATSASIALTVVAEAIFVDHALPSMVNLALLVIIMNAIVMYATLR